MPIMLSLREASVLSDHSEDEISSCCKKKPDEWKETRMEMKIASTWEMSDSWMQPTRVMQNGSVGYFL